MINIKPLSKKINAQIDNCLKMFDTKTHLFEFRCKSLFILLSDHKYLKPYIHSVKWRVKERQNLRFKLERKAFDARDHKEEFTIKPETLLDDIEDLAGIRILHLHTEQIKAIDGALRQIFKEEEYAIAEGPIAHTWDYEYEEYFKSLGMETVIRDSMYTSVHYIIQASNDCKAELQVRTLQEEVWGEVSHKINYPIKIESVACQEQIKVLARITSSGTRLVDSIFKSVDECKKLSGKKGDKTRR